MIQVSRLYKAYGSQVVFEDAGFSVNAGERVGLVGRNGSGKTTLFRLLLGEEHPDDGVIGIPNDYTIGHLSQHIRFTADSVLKEGCLGLPKNEDGRDETYRVGAVLLGLGFIADDFARSPSELSGGYQVRLNLAKVLVSGPNLLLLDEPTNYLDILSIRWLIQFLRNWKNECILITHDRDFMDRITTHTMGIHRCKIKKIEGPTAKLYDQIILEEEVYEKTRVNDEKKRRETEEFINRFRAQANKAKAVQSRIKALQKKERLAKLREIKELDFEFPSAPFPGKQPLGADTLSFSFEKGSPPLIEGFSISIGKRDRIAVVGKNGKGKTTLLNLLAGELSTREGTITRHPHLRLAYFGQTNVDRLDPQKTVEEEVLAAHPEHSRAAARTICGAMMFEGDRALKKISVLSGGERSRVLLAKLLVSPANLLLLDEPTNHLDMESVDSLLEALDAFDGAILIVTHSEMILNALATRLIVFDGGRVSVFEGTYQEFLDRVGWKDEVNVKASDEQNVSEKSKGANRKELRRIRAEIITDRSRTLGPLQNRISEVEETIIGLEGESEVNTEALVEASMKGNGEAIKRLSKSLRESKERIERLFDELVRLSSEYDAHSREFEKRLTETQADA